MDQLEKIIDMVAKVPKKAVYTEYIYTLYGAVIDVENDFYQIGPDIFNFHFTDCEN